MTITVEHRRIPWKGNSGKPHMISRWYATADGLPNPGDGATWGDALNCLIRANLETLGVAELRTIDPYNEANPDVSWVAGGVPVP
jgi:hypothetical protein